MTEFSFFQFFANQERRFQLLILAALSMLCVSCSTPSVPNSGWDEGTAYWAYQQCLAQGQNQRTCNSIGVTHGVSYTDWTYGSNLYVDDHQPTDSAFQGRFFKAARAVSYETYINALPTDVQEELRLKWLQAASVASAQ